MKNMSDYEGSDDSNVQDDGMNAWRQYKEHDNEQKKQWYHNNNMIVIREDGGVTNC